MRTWLSDYAAKLLASGLIKREKLMVVLLPLLIVSSSAIVLTLQRWDIMAGLKERKKVLLLCTLLMVRSRTVLIIRSLLEVYAVRSINSLVFILLDVTF